MAVCVCLLLRHSFSFCTFLDRLFHQASFIEASASTADWQFVAHASSCKRETVRETHFAVASDRSKTCHLVVKCALSMRIRSLCASHYTKHARVKVDSTAILSLLLLIDCLPPLILLHWIPTCTFASCRTDLAHSSDLTPSRLCLSRRSLVIRSFSRALTASEVSSPAQVDSVLPTFPQCSRKPKSSATLGSSVLSHQC